MSTTYAQQQGIRIEDNRHIISDRHAKGLTQFNWNHIKLITYYHEFSVNDIGEDSSCVALWMPKGVHLRDTNKRRVNNPTCPVQPLEVEVVDDLPF